MIVLQAVILDFETIYTCVNIINTGGTWWQSDQG